MDKSSSIGITVAISAFVFARSREKLKSKHERVEMLFAAKVEGVIAALALW